MRSDNAQLPNVLIVSVEDLNDYVEPLGGHPQVSTPNISRLAAQGTVFTNTFAPAPACSPARTAVLFGKKPWETGVYTNSRAWYDYFSPEYGVSLFGALHNAGFETHGAGKVFYGGIIESEWDTYFKEPLDVHGNISAIAQKRNGGKRSKLDYGPSDQEGPLYDERNAQNLMGTMKAGAAGQVWALGIYRPHLPFIAPRRFFDLYPETVTPAPGLKEKEFNPFEEDEVKGLSREARRRIVRKNKRFAEKLFNTREYNSFLRAYLASISYADFVLGQVLDRLESLGLLDKTYIVLWSDHGWHFGEKNAFRKFTLWERSLRTPMIFAGPGILNGVCERPVSNTDLGPTLLDLVDVDQSNLPSGISLRAQLEGQPGESLPPVVSVSCFLRKGKKAKKGTHVFAWSIRSARYRLIRYWNGGIELYDHDVDPHEHNNLVQGANKRKMSNDVRRVVKQLSACLPADPAPLVKKVSGIARASSAQKVYPHWVRSIDRR